ncbi:MAG: hypothetical protein Q4D14_01355 [Bacteroidales bacterium]|nr:hypothetical protein [Bacteroidales bacterium]
MNYVKVILSTLAVAACIFYLGWIFLFTSGREKEVCEQFIVNVTDADKANFVDSTFIIQLVKQNGQYPVGKHFYDINLNDIENVVNSCPMVLNAVCYRTTAGEVKVDMSQRKPMYRVMAAQSGSYYVDDNHQTFPTSYTSSVNVPLVSGYLSKETAKDSLYDFMIYIKTDKFWSEQTAQVYVDENNVLMIVPRVGSHVILLGDINNYQQKLDNVKTFYKKVINEVGWNAYATIDVRYHNQIICTPNN